MHALFLVLSLHAGLGTGGDRWFGPDKLKHFFVSSFVESASYSAFRATRMGHDQALVAASGVTLLVGVGKEVRDAHTAEGFSVRDLTWDLAGAASAAAVLTHAH